MTRFEFFFDCSSPWTYLGFVNVQPLAALHGVDIVWRPILVGGVFNAVNDSVYRNRENPVPAKAAYSRKDLQDWARLAGIAINWPSIFPVNSVKAMRGCFVAEEAGVLVPYAQRVFAAYWGEDRNIADDAVLGGIAEASGLGREHFLDRIAEPAVKERLKTNTQELIDRGGFGSPTMFVDGTDMYFGNDRLPLVDAALRRRAG
ncbi:MAG: 2-hydroxychromene-2-carboxylate isomerase [Alphaproteobacteria bacterium]|nr:2-hydroxychromene-2-carboxylate isomerase [Alphaproteobacteria bacterium]